MALNANDIQLCLWKMLKLSSKTCLNISKQHPYASSSFLFLFILYLCFPLLFWILIYSLPLLVSTCLVLAGLKTNRDNVNKAENSHPEIKPNECTTVDDVNSKKNKAYNRVHSVRRRRAKEIKVEETQPNVVEEKNTVSSTDFTCDVIDKNALVEEIREVEIDLGQNNNPPIVKQEIDETSNPVRRLGILKDDEDEDSKSTNKNAMEVGVLDAERNQRLESLIARRRSRKLLSLQVRRSLLNMERNDGNQIASLVLPKINTYSPNKMGGMFSPGPGSAPSVLIPMRNPFDLPYDPQEERPILTGDSFHQEFTLGKEAVYCRHESFSLGPSLPDSFFDDQDETLSFRDFGMFRRCSTGLKFFRHGNESPGRRFSPIHEQELSEQFESKPNTSVPDDDQIKEVIQVHENDVVQNHHTDQEQSDPDESSQIPQSDFNYSSTSRSPSSSSSSDQPVCKIDREAILKSLSFMRRNALLEIENNDRIGSSEIENRERIGSDGDPIGSLEIENNDRIGLSDGDPIGSLEIENNDQLGSLEIDNRDRIGADSDLIGTLDTENNDQIGSESNLSYANSALENASRLKQQYYADKPARRHRVSYSIASDMQVEVSEMSSPPVTIDENMSYQDDQDVSWDGDDSWAGAARPSYRDNDHDMIKDGDSPDCIPPSSEEAGESSAIDSNDHQEQSLGDVQTSMISPKSVLLPTLSLNPTVGNEPIRDLGDGETSQSSGYSSKQDTEESSAGTNTSVLEIIEHESVNEEQKVEENGEQTEEETSNGSSEVARVHEAAKEPITEETNTRSFTNIDEAFMKDLEAANCVDSCQIMDLSNSNEKYHDGIKNEELITSMPTKEEEIVVGQSNHDSVYEDQTKRSPLDQETPTTSTSRKDELVLDETHVAVSETALPSLSPRDEDRNDNSELVGDINSQNARENKEDRKIVHPGDEQEAAVAQTVSTVENETTVGDQSNLGVSVSVALPSSSQSDHSEVLADDPSCFHLDE